jgi:hypothetical protein
MASLSTDQQRPRICMSIRLQRKSPRLYLETGFHIGMDRNFVWFYVADTIAEVTLLIYLAFCADLLIYEINY